MVQRTMILILGLGETGEAAAQWYLRQGQPLRIADTRPSMQPKVDALVQTYAVNNDDAVGTVLGEDALALEVLEGVHTLVLSPGLALTDERLARLLAAAQQRDIAVVSEVEVFAQALSGLARNGYAPKVVAITGTNGKTTVTQVVKQIALEAGISVCAAGNISPATLTALMQALDEGALPDVWVIELSSFQLAHTFSLPVLAGAVLNISQDHLDWHGSMEAYVAAKQQLYRMSDIAIFNRDDPQTAALVPPSIEHRSFGLDAATNGEDLGVVEYQGQPWLAAGNEALLPVASLMMMGKHNLSNALAALTLIHAVGIDWQPAIAVLRNYYGEPHRCQFVRTVQGVDFINDSKGTNVGATVAAIEGLDRPLVLIMGGLAKGQDFSAIATALAKRSCRAVVLIGQDAPVIEAALAGLALTIQTVPTLTEAVSTAYSHALPADAVLFSPACASMDMFSNYLQRGEAFITEVNELAMDLGEVV